MGKGRNTSANDVHRNFHLRVRQPNNLIFTHDPFLPNPSPYKKRAKIAPKTPRPTTGSSIPAAALEVVAEAEAEVVDPAPAEPDGEEAEPDPDADADPDAAPDSVPVALGEVWVLTVALPPPTRAVEKPVLATPVPRGVVAMTGGVATMRVLGTSGMPGEPEMKVMGVGWDVTATVWDVAGEV